MSIIVRGTKCDSEGEAIYGVTGTNPLLYMKQFAVGHVDKSPGSDCPISVVYCKSQNTEWLRTSGTSQSGWFVWQLAGISIANYQDSNVS